jgi:hypothetical protein
MAVTRPKLRMEQIRRLPDGLWRRVTVPRLRPERVTCAKCGSSHPAIYTGDQCLICGATIDAANDRRKGGGRTAGDGRASKKTEEQYKAQISALQSERDRLGAALQAARTQQNFVYASDYEWYVELAAKGLAQRDNFPMPPSVATPQDFYEVMAAAALDAVGLQALLKRLSRAERDLADMQDELRQADAKAATARHREASA